MPDLRGSLGAIASLEALASGRSVVHRLHPAVKILAALAYIVTLVSFDRHSFSRLLPFLFYPCVLAPLSGVSVPFLLKRGGVALPFCLLAGASNLFFEKDPALFLGPLPLSRGFVALCSLSLRAWLCVIASLLLTAVTPFASLTGQLRRFGVPALLVTLFEMTLRYTGALVPEAASLRAAYVLRLGSPRGVDLRHIGSFLGSLFLRSADRAERVYAAMKCRGYSLAAPPCPAVPLRLPDALFLGAVVTFCAVFRLFDVPLILGRWLSGAVS